MLFDVSMHSYLLLFLKPVKLEELFDNNILFEINGLVFNFMDLDMVKGGRVGRGLGRFEMVGEGEDSEER